MDNSLEVMLDSHNIAASLTEEQLKKIGEEARRGFEEDQQTRQHWEDKLDEWTRLAKQHSDPKTYPWPKAANIKYPLLSTASMQFAARAYPSLIPSNGRIVNARPIGKDKTGQKSAVAEAVSIYMSYQLLEEMDNWEEEMDKLLIMLPIVGTMFKKTYWDSLDEKIVSSLVLPKNLVVNYWARTLKDAERISEILEFSPRRVKERQQSGLWLNKDLGRPSNPSGANPTSGTDDTTPYIIIEQHTYLELDDDGYKEPYIVTFVKDTGLVLRITARFTQKDIKMNGDGKLIKITPTQYYTKYGFIPNPDGGFYDIGFGVLLGPLNESVNTLINQLIDSGHLSTLQAGFIGKGLRIRMGETRFQPGEWKAVNATGGDIKQQIFPLPTREPSPVLLQLMGTLITSGKELASVAEIFTGKMPGQNTPATTTMATIEQGMKVFTAVYKRIYRAMTEEFIKLARLNSIYLDPQTQTADMEIALSAEDFDFKNHKVYPGADPTAISQTEKLIKAQGLMELLPSGVLDPVKVVQRILDAQEQPNWEELIRQEVAQSGQVPQAPDPKLQEMQMKGQLEQQKFGLQAQAQEHKQALAEQDASVKLAMKQQEHAQEMAHTAQMQAVEAATAVHKQRIFSAQEAADFNQSMMHKETEHQQKLKQTKQMAAAKPKQGAKK